MSLETSYLRTIVATQGDNNLKTLGYFIGPAKASAIFLRLPDRILFFSLLNRVYKKTRRIYWATRYNQAPYFYEPEILRELTDAWPKSEYFPPVRFPLPQKQREKLSALFFCSTLGAGGAERQLTNLALRLHQSGHRVRVRLLSLAGPDAHYAPQLREAGVDCRALACGTGTKNVSVLARHGTDPSLLYGLPLTLRRAAAALAAELLREPADIVHAFLDDNNVIAGWAGLLAGTPHIRLSLRNLNPSHFSFYKSWMDAQYAWLTRQARISLESNSLAGARSYAHWLGLPESAIEVCSNGIDPEQSIPLTDEKRKKMRAELGIPAHAPLVLAVCRASPEKRPLDLVRSFQKIIALMPDVWCLHAGQGPLLPAMSLLRDSFRSLPTMRIRFLGLRRDIPRLLAVSDVFIQCSAEEGLPNSVMEAMSAGLPVIATRAGGTEELVQEGVTGFLQDVGDVKGLTEKAVLLLRDPALREKMGTAGKERIQGFSYKALMNRELAAYRTGLEKARGPSGECPEASLPSPYTMRPWRQFAHFTRLQISTRLLRFKQPDERTGIRPGLLKTRSLSESALKNKPSVTLFIGSFGPGGAERQICLLTAELKKRGCAVRLLAQADFDIHGHRVNWLRERGIPCHALNTQNLHVLLPAATLPHQKEILSLLPRHVRPDLLALCAHLALEPPDVLHCYLDASNVIGAYAGLLTGVPAIRVSARSINPEHFSWCEPWWKGCYMNILRYPQVVLEANSRLAAEDYHNWLALPAEPEVIPNAVELEEDSQTLPECRKKLRSEFGLSEHTPVVLAVLRLSEEKCPFLMLLALDALRRRLPTVCLLHAGIGPMQAEVEQLTESLRLRKNIRFLGARHDVPALMAAADALLLTSRMESSPNVLLEAMAAGLPVVAPRVGGVPELVKDGETGFLVESGDYEGMAEHLYALLNDAALSRRMGENGKRYVACNHTIERFADNVLAAYARQLAERNTACAE
ncbi:MAG: glycosyltransferase [Desulfovibrio sp.]|jgi:glycosyltransferase involved in cell wall biosynthesis|nr:glycosyltransferase [Desulfovibrio sp.]